MDILKNLRRIAAQKSEFDADKMTMTKAADKIERYEKALVEIEYHSSDKNAAATARAALAS